MNQPATPPRTTPTGIALPCPSCGEPGASIAVNLGQLDDAAFTCNECSADFSIEQVQEFIDRWTAVLSWVRAVPQFPE